MTDAGLYRVRAHNIAADSENKIHDDAVARQYGFSGGLVPGIVVYGYLTRPMVERFGTNWLMRGTASARFVQPCYEDEEIVVRATPAAGADALQFTLEAERPNGTVCAQGTATLPECTVAAPGLDRYPTAPLPTQRPTASATTLTPGTVLGTLVVHINEHVATEFAESIRDDLSLYRGPSGVVHPALILGLANQVLVQNVELGPWIHTASEVTHFAVAHYGDTISLRSTVAECFDRKGHEFVVLDLLVVADPDRPIQQIRHTAIYRPRITR